jgi:hypothetical protein
LFGLPTVANFATVQMEGNRMVKREIEYYNLDAIISVGYRIRTRSATLFRIWATKTLKEYILKGYAVHQRFERIEKRITETEKKIDFFIKNCFVAKYLKLYYR